MITIYKPADVTVDVINGNPPVDQSAQVAALQAQVAQLEADKAALEAKIATALSHAQATVSALQ